MGWFSNLFKKKKKKQTTNEELPILSKYDALVRLKTFWPELRGGVVHMSDKTYVMPTYNEVLHIVNNSTTNDYIHTYYINRGSGIFDCDDFAILLHAEVIKVRYNDLLSGKIPENIRFPFAFGQIWYDNKVIGSHAVNLAITSDRGIVFIEPQLGKISSAVKDCNISFIRI